MAEEDLVESLTKLFAQNQHVKLLKHGVPFQQVRELMRYIEEAPAFYRRLPSHVASSPELITAILEAHGESMFSQVVNFISAEAVEEEQLGRLVASIAATSPHLIAGSCLAKSREFVLRVVALNKDAFKYAQPSLQADFRFCLECVLANLDVANETEFAALRELDTKSKVQTLLRVFDLEHQDTQGLEEASLSVRFTRLFATVRSLGFEGQGGTMPRACKHLLDVQELCRYSEYGCSDYSFEYYSKLPDSLARNEELVKKLLETHGTKILAQIMSRYKHYDAESDVGKLLLKLASELPSSMYCTYFWQSKEFVLDLVKLNPKAFESANFALRSNVDFVLACMMEDITVGTYSSIHEQFFKSLTSKDDVKTSIAARAYAQSQVGDKDDEDEDTIDTSDLFSDDD